MDHFEAHSGTSNTGDSVHPTSSTTAADAGAASSTFQPNVPGTERVVTGAAGVALTAWGIRHGGVGGLLGAVAGAALLARSVTGHCPMYAKLGTSQDERSLAERLGWRTAATVQATATVNRPRDVVYRHWRDLSNFGSLMSHVEKVEVIDERRSRWVVKAPMGHAIEFDSTLTEDIEGRRLAWLADDSAAVRNSGWVEFRDTGDGDATEVRLFIAYEPPGGELGRVAARFLREEPGHQAHDDLQRFKRMMETGSADDGPGRENSAPG